MTSDISLSSPNLLPQEDADYLCSLIRTIPDFPSEGILFRDFMPVFAQAKSMNLLIQGLVNALPVMPSEFDYIAGLEARGFLIGTALAQKLDKGFIAVRKAGKLPPPVLSQSYDLEYGKATMEIEKDLVKPGSRILIVDDLIATGGTAWAAMKLFESIDCSVAGFSFVMELDGLDGTAKLDNHPMSTMMVMPA
ncbi:adenine phosphoribosyltransferase [Alloscardovia omnicolens]|jgi:adenine phosphoribosyltransferase|uniref:Adenine phosphoribosyltransferase n=2 Tax=Alloscardovia omnicolens TaxID=419015 RepID=U1R9F6_9BIFI|nr:adenine phosphoribosyltransferase [Alloscardovia omnicolens]ERH30189.1 adenine phosphoribosyltransferase [Alloscardovia omnicolens F0580]KWZ73481.1 adenine phosphoribosyltransferase [Alloscardovia omnicolens]MBS6346627.1 adenine phosphoribosyltransferase [Alloscardovia omnicolens]MDK6248928.1 adenine phosphoribosyltransferase [Alloscardovia omnicolens]MDK6328497.1 adenine phosphoribosyltransferase [Alloscardovia omnicolens]